MMGQWQRTGFSWLPAAAFTVLALWAVCFLRPHFPASSFFSFPLPYWFPLTGFLVPFWALVFGYRRLSLVWLVAVLPLFLAANIHLLRHDVYFLWLCLLTASLAKEKQDLYNGLLLVMAGMYCWTGFQKMHPGFVDTMAPVLQKRMPPGLLTAEGARMSALAIPISELLLGAACLTRFRRVRAVLGTLLHAGILFFLLYGKWNLSMVFWNIALPGMLWLLPGFRIPREKRPFQSWWIPVFMAVLCPFLGFVSLWPGFASWNMYSARIKHYYLPVTEGTALHPPAYLRDHIYSKQGEYVVGMATWCDAETGGSPCMEPVFRHKVWADAYAYIGNRPNPAE